MPRHNTNADYHRQNHQFRDKYLPNFYFFSEIPERPKSAIIKTTGESIVREYRKSEMMRTGSQPYDFKRKPTHIPWYRAISWDMALVWGCSIALGFCLVYLTIFVFAPFCLRLANKIIMFWAN